jgi:ACT domain-containing protein
MPSLREYLAKNRTSSKAPRSIWGLIAGRETEIVQTIEALRSRGLNITKACKIAHIGCQTYYKAKRYIENQEQETMMQKTVILELRNRGYPFSTVAATVGCSEDYAREVWFSAHAKRTNDDQALIVTLGKSKVSIESLADKFDTTQTDIREILQEAGIKVPLQAPRTDVDAKVVELHNKGVKEKDICEQLRIDRNALTGIKRRLKLYKKRELTIAERAPQIIQDMNRLRKEGYKLGDALKELRIASATYYTAKSIIEKEAP